MKGIKITLPDKYNLFIDDLSYLQDGELTDLVVLTGGHFNWKSPSRKIIPCSSHSVTKSVSRGWINKIRVYYKDNYYETSRIDDPGVAIRPVLELSNDMFEAIINNSEVFNIEFNNHTYEAINLGTFPQYTPSKSRVIELGLPHFKLPETGNKFTLSSKTGFKTYKEYEYKGKKYIQIKTNIIKGKHEKDKPNARHFRLSNDLVYASDHNAWMEVSPVIWIIDRENKKLISFRNLLAGIPFDSSSFFDGNPQKATIMDFLNEFMLPQLLQDSIITKKSVFLIDALLEEINTLHKNYYGNENVPVKVAKLIDDYNANVDKTTSPEPVFQVDYKPLRFYRDELVIQLTKIRDMLKTETERVKPYIDMLQILRHEDDLDELACFIENIKDGINKTEQLGNKKAGLLNDLWSVKIKHIRKCQSLLDTYKDTNEIPSTTLAQLKQEFRIDLHVFLEYLHMTVQTINADQERKIMQDTINKQYEKDKSDRIAAYEKAIDESESKIRSIGNSRDIADLDSIINYKLDYSKSIKELVDELEVIFDKVYSIELRAKTRIEARRKRSALRINPNKVTILKENSSKLDLALRRELR